MLRSFPCRLFGISIRMPRPNTPEVMCFVDHILLTHVMEDMDLIRSCFIEISINCRGSTSTCMQSSMLVATYSRWTDNPTFHKLQMWSWKTVSSLLLTMLSWSRFSKKSTHIIIQLVISSSEKSTERIVEIYIGLPSRKILQKES